MLPKPILPAKPVEGRSPVSLSVTEVRAIVLRSQRLAEDLLPFGLGKTAVLKAIQHLGYIQVDPINVLQRAHHHVLWSRVPNYHPDMLHELQDQKRKKLTILVSGSDRQKNKFALRIQSVTIARKRWARMRGRPIDC
jgi:Winged helix DNA-binding domain